MYQTWAVYCELIIYLPFLYKILIHSRCIFKWISFFMLLKMPILLSISYNIISYDACHTEQTLILTSTSKSEMPDGFSRYGYPLGWSFHRLWPKLNSVGWTGHLNDLNSDPSIQFWRQILSGDQWVVLG